MTDFVRVKDKKTGHEYTLAASVYQANKDDLTKVDKRAVDIDGSIIPPKYKVVLPPAGEGYDALTVPQLNDEIARRNEDRDEENQIRSGSNRKPDLIAALEADDTQEEL